jgi:hypothetical protein
MRDFYVFTRLRSVIRAVPAQLFVSDFPCERKILVLAEEAGDFECRVGADLPSWLTVSEDTTNVPPRVKAFKVRVHKPDPGVTTGTIKFTTSIPNCPVVKVPITISSSAGS